MPDRTEQLLEELVALQKQMIANQERALAVQDHAIVVQAESVSRQRMGLRLVYVLGALAVAVLLVPFLLRMFLSYPSR